MRFTNNPYEGFMKEKSYFKGVPPSLPPKGSRCDGCLTGRDRLRVLLPGAAQTTGQREVMLWAEN